jgi:hypothetical protein
MLREWRASSQYLPKAYGSAASRSVPSSNRLGTWYGEVPQAVQEQEDGFHHAWAQGVAARYLVVNTPFPSHCTTRVGGMLVGMFQLPVVSGFWGSVRKASRVRPRACRHGVDFAFCARKA